MNTVFDFMAVLFMVACFILVTYLSWPAAWVILGLFALFVLMGAEKFNDLRSNTDETEYLNARKIKTLTEARAGECVEEEGAAGMIAINVDDMIITITAECKANWAYSRLMERFCKLDLVAYPVPLVAFVDDNGAETFSIVEGWRFKGLELVDGDIREPVPAVSILPQVARLTSE